MDPAKLVLLRDSIVAEFGTPDVLSNWVTKHVPNENVHNIFRGPTFDAKAYDLLTWASSKGRLLEVLQALADDPPNGSRQLPNLIHFLTNGAVMPASSRASGIPPVAPHKDWFVTRRPFANRAPLRQALETFDRAAAGADSVLVIEGAHLSGKSHSIRFAAQCAPPDRFVLVDIADWGEVVMNAADLAQAIDPTGGTFEPFDPTKEHEAVPRILTWLTKRLRNTQTWIIIDHCNRPNLTSAAESLLFKLADTIEKGFPPGVRLIVADVDRAKLPDPLKRHSRYDRADLPDRTAVEEWCKTLAAHLGKAYSPAQMNTFVADVFQGFAPAMANDALATVLESRLARAFASIKGEGG